MLPRLRRLQLECRGKGRIRPAEAPRRPEQSQEQQTRADERQGYKHKGEQDQALLEQSSCGEARPGNEGSEDGKSWGCRVPRRFGKRSGRRRR